MTNIKLPVQYNSDFSKVAKITTFKDYSLISGEFDDCKKVARGWVVRPNGSLVSRVPNMPKTVDLECAMSADYNILTNGSMLVMPPMDYVQINVYRLEDGMGNAMIMISTNQHINAYTSKFTAPILPRYSKVTHGLMFEKILRAEDYFDEYIAKMKREPYGTVDVWWMCTDERSDSPFNPKVNVVYYFNVQHDSQVYYCYNKSDIPVNATIVRYDYTVPFGTPITVYDEKHVPFRSGDMAKFAYRIAPNGDLMYFKTENENVILFHPPMYCSYVGKKQQLIEFMHKSQLPMCACVVLTEDSNVPNVANVNLLNVPNKSFENIKKATNNDPNLVNRVVLLMQYAMVDIGCDEETTMKHIFEMAYKSTRTDMFRREEMSRQIALTYLEVLLKYNPTYVWLAFYTFNKLIDHVAAEYKEYKRIGRENNKFTFWKKCNAKLDESKTLPRETEHAYAKTLTHRDHVRNMLLREFTCFDLSYQMSLEIKLVTEEEGIECTWAKEWLWRCGSAQAIEEIFNNEQWIAHANGLLATPLEKIVEYEQQMCKLMSHVENVLVKVCLNWIMMQKSEPIDPLQEIDDKPMYTIKEEAEDNFDNMDEDDLPSIE